MEKFALKYCGGCNPRYDRVSVGKTLLRQLGYRLNTPRPGVHYETVFVICGCRARCADIRQFTAERIAVLDDHNYSNLEI